VKTAARRGPIVGSQHETGLHACFIGLGASGKRINKEIRSTYCEDINMNKLRLYVLRLVKYALLMSCCGLATTGLCCAGVTLNVKDATVTESQEGYVDVLWGVTDGSYDLMVYMVELGISGPGSGVRFTHFGTPDNPVFPGQIAQQVDDRPQMPGSVAAAIDYTIPAQPLADGAGVLRAYFETDPGSVGNYLVSIDPDPLRTNFTNGNGQLFSSFTSVQYTPGQLHVLPAPEPPTFALLLALGPCLWFYRRCRRWRAFYPGLFKQR
jgi:hypothetical protein